MIDFIATLHMYVIVIVLTAIVDSIKGIMKGEFSKVANYFGDMESFSELVGELENAIGNYSSTVRNIKSGEWLLCKHTFST